MQTTCAQVESGEDESVRRRGTRFFWGWLILVTSVSIAGNVTHAFLKAPPGLRVLSAVAALVPPVVLLGSTHSVAVLIKARRLGWTFGLALLLTIGLAVCAFVLSYDALRDLVVMLGIRSDTAPLWPIAVDLSIVTSTLALLSLSGPRAGDETAPQVEDDDACAHAHGQEGLAVAAVRTLISTTAEPAPRTMTVSVRRNGSAARAAQRTACEETAVGGAEACRGARTLSAARQAADPIDSAAIERWQPVAESLVRDGVTSKDAGLVATILAERAAGTAPSTIGRQYRVHHTTVGKILSAAAPRTATA